MKRSVLCSLFLALVFMATAGLASAQTAPVFKLGFLALAQQIPAVVGQPVENEHFNLSNGNSEQHTTKGLMAWRKADNWTAFTDGSSTWINGPSGVQSRLNTERFPWEANTGPQQAVSRVISKAAMEAAGVQAGDLPPVYHHADSPSGYGEGGFWGDANGLNADYESLFNIQEDMRDRAPWFVHSSLAWLPDAESARQVVINYSESSTPVAASVGSASAVRAFRSLDRTGSVVSASNTLTFSVSNIVVHVWVLGYDDRCSMNQTIAVADRIARRLTGMGLPSSPAFELGSPLWR